MTTLTIGDILALQSRASASMKKRSGTEIAADDKPKYIEALTLVADGKSVQSAAESLGLNQHTLYAFVKGKKKLELLVGA